MPPRRHALIASLALTLAACAGLPDRLPVTYRDADRTIVTTVDSDPARYAVERFANADPRRDPHWDAYIDALLHDDALASDPERLARLADIVSTDFATAIYREIVRRRPTNRAFAERVRRIETNLAADQRAPSIPLVRLVLVPGWRYRSSPGNGADLERAATLADSLDLPWSRIDTAEDGTVEENAQRIVEWVSARSHAEPLVLVSASKGGPEVALALDRLREMRASDDVIAWIDISGLNAGSPLAADALTFPARVFVGALLSASGSSMRPVPSMTPRRSHARLATLRVPHDVLVLHYLAAPLSGEVSGPASFTYSFLKSRGPNDGLRLLGDARIPGITLIEAGVDHFLADEGLGPRLEAVLRATLALAEERIAARGGRPLAHVRRGPLRAAQ